MRRLCLVVALVSLAGGVHATTVWIDTDISIGSPIREVDDAYALLLAFRSPEIRIAGISASYGNAPLGHTNRAAQNLVRKFGGSAGLDVLFAGAESPRALGRRTRASDALAATLRKKKLTYIALGPLTNLATILKLHPGLADQIERVIFLGGHAPGDILAFGPNRSFRIHDANVFKDPVAVRIVLASDIPIVLVPIQTASRLQIDRRDLRALKNSGLAGQYLSKRSGIWLWFWTHFVKTKGGPLFDALAILPVARPQIISLEERYAALDESGNLIVTSRSRRGARPVRYCTSFARGTKQFVLRRIGAP